MDKSISPAPCHGCLEELARLAAIQTKIASCLAFLSAKRETLEEKAIAAEFARIGAHAARIASTLFQAGAGIAAEGQAMGELRQASEEIEARVGEFLQVARYDANFLEQYFEYDFNTALIERHRFSDRLAAIEAALQARPAGPPVGRVEP